MLFAGVRQTAERHMDMAFDPSGWHDFYLMVGGSAAALTGLVFVAMSLQLRPILPNPWHRGTAAASIISLLSVMLVAAAALATGQPRWLLGLEIILITLPSPLYNLRGLIHLPREHRLAFALELTVGLAGAVLAMAAGLSLMLAQGPGLWLLLSGAGFALASSVWNGWRLMVDVASTPPEGSG
jgi:hypothetical protein